MRFSVVIWGELICSHYQNDGSSETIDVDYYFYLPIIVDYYSVVLGPGIGIGGYWYWGADESQHILHVVYF